MKNKLLLLSLLVVPFGMSVTSCKEEHTYHVWEKSWTFDEESHWLKCSKCDATNFKSAHQFDDGVITTAPTKTADGVKTFKCEMCGYEKTETVTFEDAHIHSWNEGEVTTPATETEDGVKTYTCSTCGETKTEAIPKTGNNGGTSTTTEVDGFVMVDSIKDEDNLYIISSADGITYNAMTATIKDSTLPWYFNYALTDYDLTKDGISSMEETAEQFKFVKQSNGSYIIQTKNGLYLYSYVDGSHYSIGLCNTTAADKGGTVYWNITKKDNGFLIKGTTTNVYLKQYISFCGDKNEPSFPIYLFEPGKITVNNGGGSNDDYTGSIAEDPRWNLDFTQYGYTFRDTLASLIKAKVTKYVKYEDCLGIGKGAAATRSGYYVPFYHGEEHSTSESANREHTWPNSRGGGSKEGGSAIENDPYMVRPTLTEDNDARKNKFYGIGSNEWDPASCGFEAARGESARVIFYVATKFGKSHGLSLSNNPGDATTKKTMGTLKYLVEWNRKYPVTEMEKQINNNLEKAGFGRNPFVDHPEYAEFIWTTNGVQTSVPAGIDVGGSGSGGTNTGNNGGSGTGTEIPPTPQPNYEYSLVSNLDELNGLASYIVNDGKAMTSTNKKDNNGKILPYYFVATDADISSDKLGLNVTGATKFTFGKQADGSYTIGTSDGYYLYTEVSNKHYNVKISNSGTVDNKFIIDVFDDGYYIKGKTTNVYLTLGTKGSFEGAEKKPSKPIYLYK